MLFGSANFFLAIFPLLYLLAFDLRYAQILATQLDPSKCDMKPGKNQTSGGFWRADIGVDSGGENIRALYIDVLYISYIIGGQEPCIFFRDFEMERCLIFVIFWCSFYIF